jgi:GPN-loop GTPase
MGTLIRSMSMVLDEFYKTLRNVGVSAVTGESSRGSPLLVVAAPWGSRIVCMHGMPCLGVGVDNFFAAVNEAAEEFEREYLPDLLRRKAEQEKGEEDKRAKSMDRLMRDLKIDRPGHSQGQQPAQQPDGAQPMDEGAGEDAQGAAAGGARGL